MVPSTQLGLVPQSSLVLSLKEQVYLRTIPADKGSKIAHWASRSYFVQRDVGNAVKHCPAVTAPSSADLAGAGAALGGSGEQRASPTGSSNRWSVLQLREASDAPGETTLVFLTNTCKF